VAMLSVALAAGEEMAALAATAGMVTLGRAAMVEMPVK